MLEITRVDVKKLSFLDKNPRKIDRNQFEKLCDNIQKDPDYFDQRPCLVNSVEGKLTVYAGNQRLRAAKKLGWKQVPCVIQLNLPEELIRRRVVLDNIHHWEFDWDLLTAIYDVDELLMLGLTEEQLVGDSIDSKAETLKNPKATLEFKDGEISEEIHQELERIADRWNAKLKVK